MPFNLTYGMKVVILVEIGVTSLRRKFFSEDSNDDQLKLNLDYLGEVRNEASKRIAKYQQKMTRYYNQRVRLKGFSIGDLV